MKKSLKIILAAAMLSLCLVLTGCYQPLDDTTYDTGGQTSNQQPYNTATPTPVVKLDPDSPTPGTQAPQPQTGNQGGVTVTNPPTTDSTQPGAGKRKRRPWP